MKLKGSQGWLVVAGVITIIDLLATKDETLSEAAHRALKKHPVAVLGLVGFTSAHLTLGFDRRWRKVDPFVLVGLARKWTALK